MSARPTRRWYQFSLRALIVLTVAAAVPLAAHVGYKRYLVAQRLAEIESSFQWLESLGYPRLDKAPPICITTKYWHGEQDPAKAQTDVELGFLLSADARSFTAYTPSLKRITFERQSQDVLGRCDSDFERIDSQRLARLALGRLKAKHDDPFYRFGNDCSERCELFVLAWAFARQGHSDWAIKLYETAEGYEEHNDNSDASFQERLAADIAHTETWRATLAFQSPLSRYELLQKFRWLNQHFPKSKHAANVAEKVGMLEAMVAQDERHARERAAGLPFEQLSKSEQIDDLIFQLRDQKGYQWGQPGWCNVLNTRDSEENSPGHRLVDYGYVAIPQLAAALGDQRLTRSVGFHRNFYFSHHVLTVGEAAEQILERIVSRRFDIGNRSESDTARIEAIRKIVLDWHAEVMAKGERAYLIEAVEHGDELGYTFADRLLAKYPDEACSAILRAIRRTKDDSLHTGFVQMLGRIPSGESVPFLLEELTHQKATHRLAAAQAITHLGRPEGIDAMLRRWQISKHLPELDVLGPFLAESGRQDALEAVAQRLPDLSIDGRIATIGGAMQHKGELLAARPELRRAVIQLLIIALPDTAVQTGMSGIYGNKSFSDPRVCDLAGHHLNCLDAAAFPFDLAAPFGQREAARLAILATHRD